MSKAYSIWTHYQYIVVQCNIELSMFTYDYQQTEIYQTIIYNIKCTTYMIRIRDLTIKDINTPNYKYHEYV